MKLLVTGAAGFIGSYFTRYWLEHHPADEVVTLDALTYAGVRATVEELAGHPRHRFIEGSICDAAVVGQAMAGCELVVHFAAETHVDRSITNAAPFLRTNVEGTHTMLRCAAQSGVRRFVHMSTDEVCGPIVEGAHTESGPLRPRSPYAASKAAGDLLVFAHQETYQLPAVIVRCTNVYGPRQLPEKFVPLSITNALEDRPLPIYGDGQQRRAWLFVEDLCRAMELIAQRGEAGSIYNVGSVWEFANLDVARMILQLLGKSQTLLTRVADRPGHDWRYALDDRRLRALGWTPQVTFEDGLQRTIEWYRTHCAWWGPLKERLREDPYHWLNRTARPGAGEPVGAAR